jgi:amino acid adenylation domain-containing protein/non-ribosomal peptide synthase protein (TIGR01720 family)
VFPTNYIRPGAFDYKGYNESFSFDGVLSGKLRTIARENNTTLNTVLLAAFSVLCGKYTGQDDITIGTLIANRHHQQAENLIGFFVNTLVSRIRLHNQQTFEELIAVVHDELVAAQLHQDLPFEKLISELAVERDPSRHPLFQVLFALQNFRGGESSAGSQQQTCLKQLPLYHLYEVTKFDLAIYIDEGEEQLQGIVVYSSQLFQISTIKRIISHYLQLVQQLVEFPRKPYSSLSMLNSKEYGQVVTSWNRTNQWFPQERTIHDIFEEQAARTPDQIALIFEGRQLTYKQLDEKSNQLASYIRDQYQLRVTCALKPDTLIALCLDRSLEMVVSILAVLKAGAAYVPIDPTYPQERVNYMLEDTDAQLILCQRELLQKYRLKLPEDKVRHIGLEEEIYSKTSTHRLPRYSTSKDLAYVLYTSGTTGTPKGAMLEHAGIVNRLMWMQSMYPLTTSDVVLQKTPYVFDVSVWELLWANWYGATILLARPDGQKDHEYLHKIVNNHNVTTLHFVPNMLDAYNHYLHSEKRSFGKSVSQVFCSGEALHKKTVEHAYQNADSDAFRLHNLYGPTEASIDVTYYETSVTSDVTIGSPIHNTRVYILDSLQHPVPIGVPGELYIGGAGLARGYLNKPELTTERFIANPFASEDDKAKGYTRLYRTGDLVKWLPDGNIEYIGRNDEQVKIRGFRVELSEIEQALSQVTGIKQSCVIARERKGENSGKYLVGYYVKDAHAQATAASIQQELSQVLPDYMVPTAFVEMKEFPVSVNGKLDKKALPDVQLSDETYVAPTTETEEMLCRIWQQVLGIERVGVTDNFFRIGGDSILSIQVCSRIRQGGLSCQVKDIFECKTIRRLAEHISRKSTQVTIQSEQGVLTGGCELLPIQQRFFEQVEKGLITKPHHWNQSFLIKVPELDKDKLESILQVLISYHDVLRMQYIQTETSDGTAWKQIYTAKTVAPVLLTADVCKESSSLLQDKLTLWQSGFDLSEGPLFQVAYLYGYEDRTARIYVALHHLISDAVSWRILADDIHTLYNGNQLSLKGSSYRQWARTVRQYCKQHPNERSYWDQQLQQIPQYLAADDHTEWQAQFDITSMQTKSLLQQASHAYHTEINDSLLTALCYTLRDINQSNVQGITLEGHGRENTDATIDTSHTIGWFTSIFPVKLEVQDDLRSSIMLVKEHLRKIPNKGIGFGSFAVDPSTNYFFDALPSVSFNYLGQFDGAEGMWQIAGESSGKSIDERNYSKFAVDISGFVINGQLRFNIVTKLGKTITRHLADSFKSHLTKIIDHCLSQLRTEGARYTPSDFVNVAISPELLDRLQTDAWAAGNQITNIFPANSLQRGFIYHALTQTDDDAYRVQSLYEYNQGLDIEKYIKAWQLCLCKYPSLRTAFSWEEDIIQIVYKNANLVHMLHDISGLTSDREKQNEIAAIQEDDRKKGFSLSSPALMRIHIIKQSEKLFAVLKTEHHIISDGWSGAVLDATLHDYYRRLVDGQAVVVEQDTAYLRAQHYIAINQKSLRDYWSKVSLHERQPNNINALLDHPINLSSYKHVHDCKSAAITIGGSVYQALKEFIQKEGFTMNVIVQFAWHKLLHVYSSCTHTIVGTTIAGRDLPIEGIEDSVGLYINTLPLLISWSEDRSVREQLHEIQRKITDLTAHGYADLASLQREGERLFHSLFIFENYPSENSQDTTLKVNVKGVSEKLDYPLTMSAFEYDERLVINLIYDGKYLSHDRAEQHLTAMLNLIQQVIEHPAVPHQTLRVMSPREYELVTNRWNRTSHVYVQERTLDELFQQQASRTPNRIAVVCETQRLTYTELDRMSNQLAWYIRGQYRLIRGTELKPDTLIALCLERSMERIVAILAVLKAGGAYVPIDPSYPPERIKLIIEDTNTPFVVSKNNMARAIQRYGFSCDIIDIDLDGKLFEESPSTTLPHHSGCANLAYVIYTSGTSGTPKGVAVEHRSVVNLVNFHNKKYTQLSGNLAIALISNYNFDFSVQPMFNAILHGHTLYIVSAEQLGDPFEFHRFLVEQNIDTFEITPTLFSQLVLLANTYRDTKLKLINIGGENLSRSKLTGFINSGIPDNLVIINTYGPTEYTVDALCYEVNVDDILKKDGEAVPIGKPIDNTRVFVLDNDFAPVPTGVTGELYIGGDGLARGYLNRPQLTTERFIKNPFASESDIAELNTRLYKTGDLVRWLPDGNLEYIGRNDEQLKIRGFRIELGEIEYALSLVRGIKQSCVVQGERKGSGDKYLVAYYVAQDNNGVLVNAADIRDALAATLPEYMIPSYFVQLQSLPVTVNGKLDKNALPEPEIIGEVHSEPTNDIEADLGKVWRQVLGLSRVGVTDNFFRIGGDSILSIQVASQMRRAGYRCNVKDIFEYKTIRKIAKHVTGGAIMAEVRCEDGVLTGECDLLPVQQWFLNNVVLGVVPNPNHWNQSFLIKVPLLDTEALQRIVKQLALHHDVLRMHYITAGTPDNTIEWKQMYQPVAAGVGLEIADVSKMDRDGLQELLTSWQAGFNLTDGPLFRIGYLHGYSDNTARIYLAFHHLVMDTVSCRIIIEDIRDMYAGKKLQAKTSSYRQWVKTVKKYHQLNSSEGNYWKEQLRDLLQYKIVDKREAQIDFAFDVNLTNALLKDVADAYHTEINDLLLTALAYALRDLNQSNIQAITLEGHGREAIDDSIDTTRTVGWFTTIFPVKLKVLSDLGEMIGLVKETLRQMPNKGIGFGAFAAAGHDGCDFEKIPLVSFNYLGQFDNAEGMWQVVSESSGRSADERNYNQNIIDINGLILEGKLRFNVFTQLGETATRQLADSLKSHIITLIEHCQLKLRSQGKGYTPSDFDDYVPYEIINEHIPGNPVFLFPPGSGGLETYYNNLVPILSGRKVVSFNNYYLFLQNRNIDVAQISFEQLGQYYRLLVEKLQPAGGSYTFIGYSFGAVLALEVSRLLPASAGKNRLIFLDGQFAYREAEPQLPRKDLYLAEFRSTIHYKYFPKVDFTDKLVTLIKATRQYTGRKAGDMNEMDLYLEDYFIQSSFNGLDRLAEDTEIFLDNSSIVKVDCDHVTMIENADVIYIIGRYFLNNLLP